MQGDSFSTSVGRQTIDRCVPIFYPWDAKKRPYCFAPNLTVAHGQLMSVSATNTNDVQTVTITGTPTAGAQAVNITNPLTTDVSTVTIPFNATAAAVQTLVNNLPGWAGNVVVGGGPWPGTPLTFTGAGSFANRLIAVATIGTSTLNAGATAAVAHTTPGATANQAIVYPGSGSSIIGPSEFDVATDAFGNITLGAVNTGDQFFSKEAQAPIWTEGQFLVADLIGVDANAVSVLGGCEPPLGQTGAVLHIR